MPRHPDPQLEERILNAARKLYLRGGEKALSMRTLAKEARSNTPALYRRFRNRKEILRALVQRTQQDLFSVLEPCRSVQEACQCTFEFILAHSHEYQLISAGIFAKVNEPRPNIELMKTRCAQWLGGSPEDHASLVLILWALVHGTATLLYSKAIPSGHAKQARSVMSEAIEVLVRNSSALSVPK